MQIMVILYNLVCSALVLFCVTMCSVKSLSMILCDLFLLFVFTQWSQGVEYPGYLSLEKRNPDDH